MKNSHKLIFFSVLAVIALWTSDAIVDSYFFSTGTFLNSLILNITPHEIYFRLFFIGSFIIFVVITLRILFKKKELEERILLAKKDWEEVFDTISDAITVHDKDFNIVRANKAAEKLLVSSFSDIIGKKKCYELFHGKNTAPEECPSCKVFKTGKPSTFEIFEPHLNKYIEIRAMPRFDSNNQIAGLTHIARDITRRKETENELARHKEHLEELVKERTAELRKANERELILFGELKTIFDTFPVGIVYLDNDYKIIRANSLFNNLIGVRGEDIIGKRCYDVAGEYSGDTGKKGDEKICSFCGIRSARETMRPAVIERPLFDKFVRVTSIPEFNEDGSINRFIEIIEDITERKSLEEEAFNAIHLASLGELSAGVAHEINNPVNGIINYTQLLINRSKDENQDNDIFKRILKEGNRIESIVKGLLTFARGNKEEKTAVSIHKTINEAIALIGHQLKKDGITLVVEVSENLPEILANQNQLEQVVLNIISNSRYALNQKNTAPYNGKCIEITGETTGDLENQKILLTFYDNGTGIPFSIREKIMTPFFSTKPTGVGTGLGLSISYGIIKDHDGRLTINSEEGKYTKIVVELPVYSAAS